MSTPYPREYYERLVESVNECMDEGFPLELDGPARMGNSSAVGEAGRRNSSQTSNFRAKLMTADKLYGLRPDPTRYKPKAKPAPAALFTFDDLPDDGEMSAQELIAHLKRRSSRKIAREEAMTLRDVRIKYDGPIGIVFFGDPHVDSQGCDWTALDRDVAICRDTPGIFAVNVGDSRDNWVGRLTKLYAHQEVTTKQSLKLIEWLFTQLPWLMTIGGNHDKWGSEHGDVAQVMHSMRDLPGLYEDDGARLRLHLPSGASFNMHVRHDFPGQSQFNGAHAFVRETLFNYRDHLLACGHRHSSAYQPIWHNDPVRLCQGFRTGSYKRIDSFQKEKHFVPQNWAPSMGVVVNPTLAHDPVKFIERCFSAEEVADKLTWARMKWEQGRSAA